MTEHTHMLAKRHIMFGEDGQRREHPAGTPCSPTEGSLKSSPDVYLSLDGAAVEVPSTEYDMQSMAVGSVKDAVAAITDFGALEAMIAEEESGRNRKGAKAAVAERIEALTTEAEEAADE